MSSHAASSTPEMTVPGANVVPCVTVISDIGPVSVALETHVQDPSRLRLNAFTNSSIVKQGYWMNAAVEPEECALLVTVLGLHDFLQRCRQAHIQKNVRPGEAVISFTVSGGLAA